MSDKVVRHYSRPYGDCRADKRLYFGGSWPWQQGAECAITPLPTTYGLFAAPGFQGDGQTIDCKIGISPDGIDWVVVGTNEDESETVILWTDITYGNGELVAIGIGYMFPLALFVKTSTNGSDWVLNNIFQQAEDEDTLITQPKICYDSIHNMFVVTCGYRVLIRNNSVWTSILCHSISGTGTGSDIGFNGITYDAVHDVLIATASYTVTDDKTRVLLRSVDQGQTWNVVYDIGYDDFAPIRTRIASGNGSVLCLGVSGQDSIVPYVSQDGGTTWSTNSPSWTQENLTPLWVSTVHFDGSKFVLLIAFRDSLYPQGVGTSVNGLDDWIFTSIDPGFNFTSMEDNKMASGNGVYVIDGGEGYRGNIFYSNNAAEWTQSPANVEAFTPGHTVAFAPGFTLPARD